jgi:hypothetical protein
MEDGGWRIEDGWRMEDGGWKKGGKEEGRQRGENTLR